MTEIEIRGKVSKKEFDQLLALLKKDGKLKDTYHRISVDLSPGFDPKTRTWKNNSHLDLRIKKSGESEKISLKVGEYHLKERKEIDTKLKEGELLHAVELIMALGYDQGMIYSWDSWEFDYQGYEIKLSKYADDYYIWEIEGKDNLDPDSLAKRLNMKPLSKGEYKDAINWENNHIHQIFTIETLIQHLSHNS